MSAGILLVDRHSELTYVDSLACRLLGCKDEVNMRECWHRIRSTLGLPEMTPGAETDHSQEQNAGRGPESDLEVRLSPVDNPSFHGYVVHIKDRHKESPTDITSRELLIASQVRNQNYINSALIHDLRAPLNAMEIHLELLAENVRGPAQRLKAVSPEVRQQQTVQGVGILKEELARLNRTLRILLSSDRPFRMAFTTFDMVLALQELTGLLMPKARQQRVDIQLRSSEREIQVEGNKDYLKQALLNIAINALEAMPDGGSLVISLERDENQLEIVFLDRGPGIAEAFLHQIYNLYFTTKAQGSGMGLFAAQLVIADAHGGSIDVSNSGSGGARVSCRLPVNHRFHAQGRPAKRMVIPTNSCR